MRFHKGMVVLALLWCASMAAVCAPAAMSASAVQAAASAVRADPLLPGTEKTKNLHIKKSDEPKPDKPPDLEWLRDFIDSLSTGLRVAVWLVGAGLLIAVLLRLRVWLQQREGGVRLAAAPPTHVGTLDIRPESLPEDVGGAALALLQRGELRAALSLLYRGALSRLVHAHAVPIRAASTEGECLALAAKHLAPQPLAYLAQLVAAWQAVAYAHRALLAEDIEPLCKGFDAQLPSAAEGAHAKGAPA